jgi:hydroxymethylglutaryl-CoA reductase
MGAVRLPERFGRLELEERRRLLEAQAPAEEWAAVSATAELTALADIMVEGAFGSLPMPLGLAAGFLVDGEELAVPMAVEEPSVIAAASFAARQIRRGGGFATWATEPVMRAQVFLEKVPAGGELRVAPREAELRERLDALQASLRARGGGYRGLEVARLPETGLVRVDVLIDVRDAMGANILDTAAEHLRPLLEKLTGGKVLMGILSNAARERRAGARFALPVELLSIGRGPIGNTVAAAENAPAEDAPAETAPAAAARRIVLAAELAREDPSRGVTHNKGIMNGISALALATMNDTRAIEAAAHAWAARDGQYRGLSRYSCDGKTLEGSLELPLPFAAVGGAVGFHPASRLALAVLGNPDGPRLARIAAALGLAQNFAALLALVTGGIQRGHMKHHAARLAYQAGARGAEVRGVAERLAAGERYTLEEAGRALAELREARE